MKDGFIKVAACTPDIRVADCAYNADSIIKCARELAGQGVGVAVFPELCVTAYTCGDLFTQSTLLSSAVDALELIARETSGLPVLFAVGLPLKHEGKLYNCAAVLCSGRILGVVPKTHLPNYGEFYERRHFAPAPAQNCAISVCGCNVPFGADQLFCCSQMENLCVGVEICEDLWALQTPGTRHAMAGATLLLNLSASDETVGKADYRRTLVLGQSARLVCGYAYADAGAGESSTDMVFAAHNLIAENGVMLSESEPFENGLCVSEIDVNRLAMERMRMTTYPAQKSDGYARVMFALDGRETVLTRQFSPTPFIPAQPQARESCCADILRIQSNGLKKRLEHSRAKTAVVGVSGGLDSALALLVAVRAVDLLGRERSDVIAVTMPCFGTTARTKNNARLLCEQLGASFREVNIAAAVERHFEDIGHDAAKLDVTYENSQARERTQVLMDIANATGGLVVGTGDLSELALGWATYNGDHMSMYGVNASVPKTLVRHLVAYEAAHTSDEKLSAALRDILDTPVSPELLPPADGGEILQKTEDLVGPYELHDFFLYYAVRWAFSPLKVLRLARIAFAGNYSGEVILKWLKSFYRRFFAQQFKRSCLPDGPKVGSVALSPRGDWRMPSDAVCDAWLRELDEA